MNALIQSNNRTALADLNPIPDENDWFANIDNRNTRQPIREMLENLSNSSGPNRFHNCGRLRAHMCKALGAIFSGEWISAGDASPQISGIVLAV